MAVQYLAAVRSGEFTTVVRSTSEIARQNGVDRSEHRDASLQLSAIG
jgi:hypothetical protein